MLIGLVFDVLLVVFVVISCLLIYSLLQIQIETKTFEIGVMRMVGLTKGGFVAMILTQAAMFVLPSIVLGFALSVPCIWAMWSFFLDGGQDTNDEIFPSFFSSMQALAIGLLIPALSAIIPIKRALSQSLSASLDLQRSKLSGTAVTITDNASKSKASYLLFGIVSVLFGISIYYILPLALIT